MTSLFISYSRKDTEAARRLTDSFKTQEWDFWIDWEGIPPTVDWWKEVEKGIEQAGVFLFLISPDSVRSKICKQEIDHAVRNGKRMIPLVVRDIDGEEVPKELAHLNWIFFRASDDFQVAFDKLTTAIRTDYDWVQAHRELQIKALEWQENKHDRSFLLQGMELQAAEFQLDRNAAKEPHLTSLQKDYVSKSRAAADRQKRTLYTTVIVVMIVLLAFAAYGWVQAGRATTSAKEEQTQAAFARAESTRASNNAGTAEASALDAQSQAQIALVRQLGAQAVAQAVSRPDLGMLLAQESLNRQHRLGLKTTRENINSLLTTMLGGPRPLLYLHGHTGAVRQVAVSPDSLLVASAGTEETIRVWDILDGHTIFTLTGHNSPVNSVDFSPEDSSYLLASGGSDGTIRLWEWTDNQDPPEVTILARRSTPVRTVAFSPSGRELAVGGEDGVVRVFDLLTRRVIHTLDACSGIVTDLAFSADGTTLASADNQTELCLWDMATGDQLNEPVSTLSIPDPKYSFHVTFNPDASYVAAGFGYNAVLSNRDVPIYNNSKVLIQHTSAILDLAYNHEGSRFASASEDWRIGYCYVDSLQCDTVLYLKAHEGPVNSVAFSPDDKWLVSGGEDGTVLVWNAQFPYVSNSLAAPILYDRRYSVVGLAFSPDGKTLASSNWDGTIRLWNVERGSILQMIPINQGNQGMISFSSDGTKLAVAAEYPPHRIWNTDGSEYRTLPLESYTSTVAFSPDGKWLATDDGNQRICLWAMDDPDSTCLALTLPVDQIVTRLAFSPDSRFLASDAGPNVLLWDLTDSSPVARELGSHDPGSSIFSLAFRPDGTKLASGGSDYTIRLWNLQDDPVSSLIISNSGRFVRSLAFSPDGLMLGSANEDWTVRWWDAATGGPLVAPVQVRSLWRMDSLAFSPDGKWLATGSFDGIIDVWPGNFEQWRTLACRIANRNLTRTEYAQFIDPDPTAYDAEYAQFPTCPNLPLEQITTATP